MELTINNLKDLNAYIDSQYEGTALFKNEKKEEKKEPSVKEDNESKEKKSINEKPIENLDTEQQLLKSDPNLSGSPIPKIIEQRPPNLNLASLPPTSKPATPESVGGLFFRRNFKQNPNA